MRMQMTFRGMTSSDAYQQQSSAWAKAQITVALVVAAGIAIFGNVHLGFHWIWALPAIVFGTSFLIAMPTMLVNVLIAVAQSGHLEFSATEPPTPVDLAGQLLGYLKTIWSLMGMGLAGLASYFFISWLSS